ncbi:hypothetical protein JQC72_04490 [Polycladomyces sp. WAk]|uniref:Uncharacterized protein n=1 Tax=Polycladomyces zharkentensis TaxID=2807616 RepID=A0ABS2WH66_9BACL|nr:hypothetical protein [Polycladomyces sp. WAk]MBN2908780.1 hypothetical protein [Polycladomyces sp. WAk]
MNIHDEMSIVLNALSLLNRKSKKEILTQEEIKEQEENLLDFEKKMKKIEEVINQLRSADSRDVQSVTDLLHELHFLFEEYLWQIDEIHTLVKKMFYYEDYNQPDE